ncbi:MAG TPA: HAD-IA family hydrolase [Bryobacteraceae bacterium]|nr:HAD-IA family hydrolase [Bryobacteraceae bacterium]
MLLIFDLDGTLIDSSKDLAIAMNATRSHMGLPEIDASLIYSFVGNGAAVLVRRALGPDADEESVERALAFFLKFYGAHALEHTQLYPGMREAIETLNDQGHSLAVLTNKPGKISFDILEAVSLGEYFLRVYGGDSLSAKKPNPLGIHLLQQETGTEANQTLMIGDSSVDVQTASNAGVKACGVTWGFQPETFEQYPPDFLVHHPQEIVTVASSAR